MVPTIAINNITVTVIAVVVVVIVAAAVHSG